MKKRLATARGSGFSPGLRTTTSFLPFPSPEGLAHPEAASSLLPEAPLGSPGLLGPREFSKIRAGSEGGKRCSVHQRNVSSAPRERDPNGTDVWAV